MERRLCEVEDMALRGNLKDFSLTQLLNLVSLAKKTGVLTVGEKKELAKLYFKEGKLIHASLNGQGTDLRRVLQKAGKLDESRSRTLPLAKETKSDKELGLLLINAGLLTKEAILEAVRRHNLETIYHLFTWTEGPFLFEPNVLPSEEKITMPIPLENVILEGSRRVKEEKRLQEELPDLGVALRFAPHPDAKLKRITLNPEEWKVVSSIDPTRSIEGIAQAHSMSNPQIRKIVYGLLSAGLVELVSRRVPLEPSPPGEAKVAVTPPPPVRRGLILRLIDRIRGL